MKKNDTLFLCNISAPHMFNLTEKRESFYLRYRGINFYLLRDFFKKNKPPFYTSRRSKMANILKQLFGQFERNSTFESIGKDHKNKVAEVFIDGEKLILFLKFKSHHVFVQPVSF